MVAKDHTVYIIDNNPAERNSLMQLIKQEAFSVQAFENAEAFLETYQPYHCDCLITDIYLPGMDGLQLQELLRKREYALPIIFLTGHGTIPQSVKAIKAGAVDFLVKPVSFENLFESIRTALIEYKNLIHANQQNRQFRSVLSRLTNREKEVMKLVVRGLSNKEIAAQLGISFRTVEIHRGHVMRKSGAANLLELVHLVSEIDLSKYGYSN